MNAKGLGVLLLLVATTSWGADWRKDALPLMQRGDYKAALSILQQPTVLQYEAGGPEYDYALGLALLETNQPEAALTALERVVLNQPNNKGARLDMALCYAKLGSFPEALHQVSLAETGIMADTPPAVVKRIADLRKSIESLSLWENHYSFNLGYGSDSNITAVTKDFENGSNQTWNIPLLPTEGNATLRKSGYTQVGASGQWLYKPKAWRLGLASTVSYKAYTAYKDYNTLDLYVQPWVGYQLTNENLVKLSVLANVFKQKTLQTDLDGAVVSNDRVVSGVGADWYYTPNSEWLFGVTGRFTHVKNQDSPISDLNSISGGVILTWAPADYFYWNTQWQTVADKAVNKLPSGVDSSRTSNGVTSAVQFKFFDNWRAGLGGSLTRRTDKYAGSRAVLELGVGSDTVLGVNGSLSWDVTPQWSWVLSYDYLKTDSTFDLYDFDKSDVRLVTDYHF